MSGKRQSKPLGSFGSGDFEFEAWTTPFTDAAVEILDVAYSTHRHTHHRLAVRIHALEPSMIYRVVFPTIVAMRLLDESGLLELWEKTEEFGGRPGRTTFRVRNHAWTRESVIPFLASDGWSLVIATDNDCLEVVSVSTPIITAEEASTLSPPNDP